ncbi:MAG: phasin family protein [Betaproteobacteria bacterium]|nr:phasin family protein [Betaproteobacteria bacterium]
MSPSPEELLKAQQDHFERLMSLSKVLLDSTEKVSEAQVASLRTQIEALHAHAARLVEARTPQEWYELQVAYLTPAGEEARAGASKTYAISRETAQEVAGIIEKQVDAFNHKVNDAFTEFTKQWPQGQEPLNAAFHSLMAAGSNAYVSAHRAFGQAVEMAEANARALQAALQRKN